MSKIIQKLPQSNLLLFRWTERKTEMKTHSLNAASIIQRRYKVPPEHARLIAREHFGAGS